MNDPAIFADMDFGLLARQIAKIAARCQESGLYLNTYPKVMSEDNIRKYFSADWFSMSRIKKRCSFPWISTEISARGDVTSCHAFYDLSLGNVYDVQHRRYLARRAVRAIPELSSQEPPADLPVLLSLL